MGYLSLQVGYFVSFHYHTCQPFECVIISGTGFVFIMSICQVVQFQYLCRFAAAFCSVWNCFSMDRD